MSAAEKLQRKQDFLDKCFQWKDESEEGADDAGENTFFADVGAAISRTGELQKKKNSLQQKRNKD